MAAVIQSVYYYPVKGLGGTACPAARLTDKGLPFDRRFGLAFCDSRELFNGGKWQPWKYFVSLKSSPRAAQLRAAAMEDDGGVLLSLHDSSGDSLSGHPADPDERRQLEAFLSESLEQPELRLFDSRDAPLWDDRETLSLVNLETVSAFAAAAGQELSPMRFRANVFFDGAPAWAEENWRGALQLGDIACAAGGGIPRCAATKVNPDTAVRDCNPPQLLMKLRGHNCLGIYAAPGAGGVLRPGMPVRCA